MMPPKQAVILCGGLGTRMRPLTDIMPKPMAPVNGRPFLECLVEQIRDQGLQRVLLLTGYKGEMIRDYFGDGAQFGIEIGYSSGPAEWDTGRRLWEARAQLDAQFLLLYSDNFAMFSLDKLISFHATRGVSVSLLLQPKARGNIRVREDGVVAVYDRSRSLPDLTLVEIGYMLVERDRVLALFDQPDISFSDILQRLVLTSSLAGMISRDPYHSISDPERWKLAERYLAVKRILLIDRDGTINRRPPRGEYVTRWEEFHWVDETVAGMRRLATAGFTFIVLSNQAGIARGMLSADSLEAMNRRMVAELAAQGIRILDCYVCPHHWDDGCECRKPATGMFVRAAREHLVRMDRTAYIGDDVRDCRAAYNAGCLSVMLGPERRLPAGGGATAAYSADTLPEVVETLIDQFEKWERAARSRKANL